MAPLGRDDSLGYKKGTILRDGRYKVEREVNRGGSAVVYLAYDQHNNNRKVALKVMDYTNELQILYKSVKREVAFSAHTNHPNTVQLLDVFADKERRTLVIVWEFIEGPDLLECLNRKGGPLAEGEAAFYFCQLLRGLLFMHQTGFAHRDLKPENCVLQESTKVVKLIDFGLTKHIESARTMLVGTPEYMAPELVRSPNAGAMLRYAGGNSAAGSNQSSVEGGGSPASSSGPPPPAMMKRYDARKVDAWALGVLFYVLVCAQYPFSDSNGPGSAMAAQRALMAGKYKPLPESLSGGARRIIQGLLVVDPQARMDLEDVAQDPWLLESAMEYAAPRGLKHLVEPPLAPPRHQLETAAAAEAQQQQQQQRRRRSSGRESDASGQQQQQQVLRQSVTGSTVVSTVSNASDTMSDTVSTHADAVATGHAAGEGSQKGAAAWQPAGSSRTSSNRSDAGRDTLQQPDQQQQQQHGYKHVQYGAGAPAAPATDEGTRPFEPFAAAAAAAAQQAAGGAPNAQAAGGADDECYPRIVHDTLAYGLSAVKEESGSLNLVYSGGAPAGRRGGRSQPEGGAAAAPAAAPPAAAAAAAAPAAAAPPAAAAAAAAPAAAAAAGSRPVEEPPQQQQQQQQQQRRPQKDGFAGCKCCVIC